MFELELREKFKKLDETGFKEWLWDKLRMARSTSSSMKPIEREALYFFLTQHGYNNLLIEHCVNLFAAEEKVPWSYFFSALKNSNLNFTAHLPPSHWSYIKTILQESEVFHEASRSSAIDAEIPDMVRWRIEAREQAELQAERIKNDDFDQLYLLRAQQLVEREREMLFSLQKKYPNEPIVLREVQKFRERYAEEIIVRHKPRKPTTTAENIDDTTLSLWREMGLSWVKKNPEMLSDIVMNFIFLDMPSIALEIWQKNGSPATWLGATLLLETERYVELLALLPTLEQLDPNNAESFFSSTYLRAQAYWGIGQKEKAIEVIEALLATRPDYRTARELLQTWRTQG